MGALWRCEYTNSHQNPLKTPKMGRNRIPYETVSLRTGKKHEVHRTMSHVDGSATWVRFLLLWVTVRRLSILADCTAASLRVTILTDCELQECGFLLQSDQRASPGTGRHSPPTNGSKFMLKRAKTMSNSVVFRLIMEEPPQPTGRAIIRDNRAIFQSRF